MALVASRQLPPTGAGRPARAGTRVPLHALAPKTLLKASSQRNTTHTCIFKTPKHQGFFDCLGVMGPGVPETWKGWRACESVRVFGPSQYGTLAKHLQQRSSTGLRSAV